MRGLLLVALLSAGCVLEAKNELVKPGETIWVVWDFTDGGAVIGEALTVDAMLKDGWIRAHSPGDTKAYSVNLGLALQFTPIAAQPHRPTGGDDGVRERASR